MNALTRLMTFTNGGSGEGWECRQDALDDVARFVKVHGARAFGSTALLLVAEQGGKGARWHVHALMPATGWLPYSRIIRLWSVFLTNRGYVSASGLHRWHAGDDSHKHSDGFHSARIAARYAAKYLTKDMLQDGEYGSGRHRYRCSRVDYPVPVVQRFPTLSEALAGLSCRPEPIEAVDMNGELHTVGYWFDGG
jgi:hypothetical protein